MAIVHDLIDPTDGIPHWPGWHFRRLGIDAVQHHAGDQSGGFGAQSVGAKAYFPESVEHSGLQFDMGEISFRPNEHKVMLPWLCQLAEQYRVGGVCVGNKSLAGGSLQQIRPGSQGAQLRKPGLLRLLHGGDGYFLQSVELYRFSFGLGCQEETDLLNADFGCLFHKPFDAVVVLGRRQGDMDNVWRARHPDFFFHLKRDVWVRSRETGAAPTAITIGEGDRITGLQSQYARSVNAFRLGQLAARQIRNVEYQHR